MSWLDQVQTNLVITCGDGRSYTPKWVPTSKSKEWNISEFDFIGIAGTYVNRKLPKGSRYNIEFYFTGENHLDDGKAFEKSSDDPRNWIVNHPYNGTILVQPFSMTLDYSSYNVTKFTGILVETINDNAPTGSVNPIDEIVFNAAQMNTLFNSSFVNNIPIPDTKVINKLKSNTLAIYSQGAKSILNTADAQNYFNFFKQANAAITKATSDPLAAIRAVQSMVNEPALFVQSVKSRLSILVSQFNTLRTSILVNLGLTKNDKHIYENNAGGIIGAMCLASVSNLNQPTITSSILDYSNRTQVLGVVDSIINSYNAYMADLDSLQSNNYNSPDSYMPDAESIMQLSSLVNFTISNLFNIALSAKQERIIYLDKDTNIVNLTHRYIGLQPDDSTIDTLISNNNIGLNELLQLKKGRKIVYYV